jgi:hypothetical protein
VCGSCNTVVRRSGSSVEAYGTAGEIREDATLLCLGTRGSHQGKSFTLVGRLQLQYLDGTWNEWHMAFSDGSFGWLAEAQGFYSVHRPVNAMVSAILPEGDPNQFAGYRRGSSVTIGGQAYVASNVGTARCIGGEGELPFPVAQGYDLPFVDLTSVTSACGTVDFSDVAPKVFLGQFIEFDELDLKGLRPELPPEHAMAIGERPPVEPIQCPSCGGGLERKTGLQAKALYCSFCGGGIDLTAEPYTIFVQQEWNGLAGQLLQLGDKGNIEGETFEVLAILIREAVKWQVKWTEYLLYNPKKGYRWLIDSNGHMSWCTPLHEWPQDVGASDVQVRGHRCSYKEANEIAVRQVVGELYWRVRIGDTVRGTDFVNAPYIVSREVSDDEVTWSLSEYQEPKAIYKAFGKQEPVRKPLGYVPHQPAPQDRYWKKLIVRYVIALLLLGGGTFAYMQQNKTQEIATKEFTVEFSRGGRTGSKPMVRNVKTLKFEVPEGPTALEVELFTEVSNSWLFFELALHNADTGQVRYYSKEIDSYEGSGGRTASIVLPGIDAGMYTLAIWPMGGDWKRKKSSKYKVVVRRDVVLWRYPLIAFGLLTLPLLFVGIARGRFIAKRKEA